MDSVIEIRLDEDQLAAIAKIRAGEDYDPEIHEGDAEEAREWLEGYVEQALEEAEDM